MILPPPSGFQRVSAQAARGRAGVFAMRAKTVSIRLAAASVPQSGVVACQYRYPSPDGRPFVPNPRPPVFSGSELTSVAWRTLSDGLCQPSQDDVAGQGLTERCGIDTDVGEPFFFPRVMFRRNTLIEGKISCSRNPGSLPVSFVPVLPPVATPWVNRPSSAARPAWARPLSPAATQAPAPWSAQPATSPIARQTRAPAAKARAARLARARSRADLISTLSRPPAAVLRGRGAFSCAASASGAARTDQ